MIFYIENEYLKLGVKDMGAELTSLVSKSTGREYIWYGKADIWYGQSPILFPVIGQLLDGKYRLDGREYSMPKHGIVRKKPFILTEKADSSLTFLQTADDESMSMYPYRFRLYVTFELKNRALTVTHRVENDNDRVMFFSIGAHPGWNCKLGDKLRFPHKQTISTERIDSDSILIDRRFPLLDNEDAITITKEIFEPDALILSGYTDREITLDGGDFSVRFDYGDAPVLGIWAKPGAPYVCIEPWFGINDSRDKKADISEKRGILSLPARDSYLFTWSAEVSE